MINTGLLCPKKSGTLQPFLPQSIKKASFEANKLYASRRRQTRRVCRLQGKERSNSRLGRHLETLAEIQPQECHISGDDLDRGLTQSGLMFRMISKPTTVTDNPVTALAQTSYWTALTCGNLDYLVVPAHTQRNHLGEERI